MLRIILLTMSLLIGFISNIALGVTIDYNSKAKNMIKNGERYHDDVMSIIKMHPKFMNHKRDKTLREGIRSEEYSLKACVNCHGEFNKDKKPIRIDTEGSFCATCHDKVGTSIDCFSCHKATPKIK